MATAKFNGNGKMVVEATVIEKKDRKPATAKGNVTILTDRFQSVYKGKPVTVQVLVYGNEQDMNQV